MEDRLVTVMSSGSDAELEIAKTYLTDNGLESVVMNNFLSMIPSIEQPRLQVREEDYNEAILILRKGGFIEEE